MLTARDTMTAHPSVIMPDDSVIRAAQLMRDRHLGVLPVVNDLVHRELAGVITDRDILVRCFAAGHTGGCLVRDHMSGGRLEWVRPEAELVAVVAHMRLCHLRRLMVLDERHGLVGIISAKDLARHMELREPEFVRSVDDLNAAMQARRK